MRCPIHGVPLVCYCPVCRGSVTSRRKAKAARENGKLGGRPKLKRNRQSKKGGK